MSAGTAAAACLLTAVGTLDSSTYLKLRDSIIKAALDEPSAVLIEISGLEVPATSAWAVFTSARWHVSTWPDIPILLICPRSEVAERIAHTGVTRYVPVHHDVESALASLVHGAHPRRRARVELPHRMSSLHASRDFVAQWLSNWSQNQLIPTAKVIVDVFVENVLRHTESSLVVRLENFESTVTIAVQDNDDAPPLRHEDAADGATRVSGLALVDALCRAWGSSPSPRGKTVWAVIGPENRL